MKPLPMTVLAGFLGSGKTTLVNHLLKNANGHRILVLVNDFGDIAIDEELIDARDGEMLSLANGCACCSMGSDLFDAFDKALSFSPAPDYLLIEASGVAEPQKIANFARAEPDLVLNSIVTIVDALNFEQTSLDPHVGTLVRRQVAAADLLLFSKTDLVSSVQSDRLKKDLQGLSEAPSIVTVAEQVDISDLVFGPTLFEQPLNKQQGYQGAPPTHAHSEMFQSWSYRVNGDISLEAIKDLATKLPRDVLRFKGIFSNKEDGKDYEIHRVGKRVDFKRMGSGGPHNRDARFVAIAIKNDDLNSRMIDIQNQLNAMTFGR
ncbi:CobW family GTP-binding protein [Sneathiella aquimaris]|uniref:CobW family GTP-binding protein n=1 Tax=Sneathiella aquimaris TaxID=2599305 RepID=UPI00146F545A|nr:CobW family GTP-binding protein [Sneathiella aquimaris]